jgi:hypothetical protein
MNTQISFYRDYGDPEVERLARAIVAKRGFDPDQRVEDNGYKNSAYIPAWWKYQDEALAFIAMSREYNLIIYGGE